MIDRFHFLRSIKDLKRINDDMLNLVKIIYTMINRMEVIEMKLLQKLLECTDQYLLQKIKIEKSTPHYLPSLHCLLRSQDSTLLKEFSREVQKHALFNVSQVNRKNSPEYLLDNPGNDIALISFYYIH